MPQCKGCAKKGICRMELMEKTVESRVLFEGKIITVRLDKAELPNGRVASRCCNYFSRIDFFLPT